MKKAFAPLSLLLLLGTSAPALSAASPEEAARITTALQAYLTAVPGVVTVTPAGDSYTVSFDAAPLLAKIKEPGFSASVSPIVMTLTSQGDGKWKVDQDQGLSIAFRLNNVADIKASFGSIKGTGIFDEALGAFASANTDISQFALDEAIDAKGESTKVTYTIASLNYASTSVAAEIGVDHTMTAKLSNLRETFNMSGGGNDLMQVSISAPDGTQDIKITGAKPLDILALASWLVAHPSESEIGANQAELKDKIRAALPLFQNATTTAQFNNMEINTMLGKFGMGKLNVLVDANGIVADGHLQEKISVAGLEVPGAIVPPFATGLVPKDFTLDFNVKDFNLAAPAKLMLDNVDMSKKGPPNISTAEIQNAFLPTGTATLSLGPSEIQAPIYQLKAEATTQLGPNTRIPASQSTIQLKGLDDIMAALQAAPPQMGMQQIAPMVMMAKGMAKPGADGFLVWNIATTPQGGVLVNGADLSKMMGGGQ